MGLKRAWYLLLCLMIDLQSQNTVVVGRLVGNILTNEIDEAPKGEETPDLPFCRSGSACGYVQVNAFGVNQQQICKCPSLTSVCPLHWDPEDGHSITLQSQQYKFCDAAPTLTTCKRAEPVYTHAMFFDQMTFDILGITATLHCYCPAPRSLVFLETTDDVIDNMQVLGSVHTCNMLPPCEIEAPCKEISVARSATLVTTNCQCRRGFVCPTLSSQSTPSEMNDNFMNGKVFSVRCQPWY